MAGEFDDLVPKSSGAFDDLIPKLIEAKGVFDDLVPKKKTEKSAQYKFTDEELKKMAFEVGLSAPTGEPEKELDLILRPLELLSAPFIGLDSAYWAGKKAEQEGKNIGQQLSDMWDAFKTIQPAYARPLGEPFPKITTPSEVGGIKNKYAGLITDMILQPSNLVIGGTVPRIAKEISGTAKISEGMRAASATKGFEIGERIITPGFRSVGKKGVTLGKEQILPDVIEGIGIKSNLPAVIQKPTIVPKVTDDVTMALMTVLEKKPKTIPAESLMGKSHAEWKLGAKNLKVSQSQVGDEVVFRLTDQSDKKIFAEMALREHPEKNLLELDWLNIDKNGLDIATRKEYRVGKPTETIPGLYKEIHHKLEMYARDKGYNTIGTNPTVGGQERLKILGYQNVADDIMGEVPYTMYKRVEQNINFERPDFWKHYSNLEMFQKAGQFGQDRAKLIYDMSTLRNMSFDLYKGKWTFFDNYLQPIQAFDKLEDAEMFVKSVRLSDKNYLMKLNKINKAEESYNLAVEAYTQRSINEASKETASYYKAAAGTKETPTTLETYRKFISPKTIQKIAKGGQGIKQKIVNSATDDSRAVFDVGTGETVGVSGNIPIRESYMSILSKIKDTPNDFYHRILTARGWLTPALHFFERSGNDVKEMFYRRIKVAEKREFQEVKNLINETNSLTNDLGLGKKNFIRIGDYAMAQDPIGKAALERSMKKVIPTLTDNEMQFYNFIRGKYEDFFTRVNEVRVFAGLEPIKYRGDYYTFFRNYDELEKLGYFLNTPDFTKKYEDFIHRVSTAFQHEKLRKGGLIPIEENANDVFLRYARSATHHIHMTPPIAINRALIKKFNIGQKVFDLEKETPHFHAWVQRWLDDVAGQRSTTELPMWLERAAGKLNKNVTYAFLSYNVRSGLIQPTAIWNSYVELGNRYLVTGVIDWFSDANQAIKKSNVLLTREYDQSVAEAFKMIKEPGYFTKLIEEITGAYSPSMRKVSRSYGGGKEAVARVGMTLLQFLDMQTAKITWNGAYKKAKNYLKMTEEEAINYADDMVTRTQGSGKISDLSQAQRTTVGKTLLMLQTFVVNNWSFLTRDVLGVSNPQMKNKERFEKIFKLLIGISITNFIFEDLLGTYSPFPTPIRTYMEERESGASPLMAGVKGLKEISELIPGGGGTIRYGSHPFGPLAETVGAIPGALSGKPGAKSPQEIGGAIFGVPATSQIKKIISGTKRNAGIIETTLGIKNPQKKLKKGKLELQNIEGFGELGLD